MQPFFSKLNIRIIIRQKSLEKDRMEITINGEKRQDFTAPLTVAELLEHLEINPKSVVVERNLTIVDKHKMHQAAVQDGDHIEIIRLVGGG